MKFRKNAVATMMALSTGLSPMAVQMTSTMGMRAAAVAGVSSLALLAPGAAHAQSGKRMCARIWGVAFASGSGANGKVSVGMEVSKYDFVTCTAMQSAWALINIMPSTVQGLVQGLFNNSVGVGTLLQGQPIIMATCESFSSKIGANTGDVCLKMTDYKFYTFVKTSNGRFSMGRTGF